MKYVDIHSHHIRTDFRETTIYNLSLSEAEDFIASEAKGFISAGIHPWETVHIDTHWKKRMQAVCYDNRVVLIGECGLDKNTQTPLRRQVDIFSEHIHLAETLHKPLIIHCVGYFNELIELKKRNKTTQKWIVHGFRGKPELAKQLLKTGIYMSFGEKYNEETIKVIPKEYLFIETDESTVPIERIYTDIATMKGCSSKELSAGSELLGIRCFEK